MADCCLDEFTDHGHCGVVDPPTGEVDNDATLPLYADLAVAQAGAGADVVAPSGMMDGQVGAIRAALDAAGHHDTAILAYAAKYASALYGPFREAAEVTIADGGDRRGYQQDPANRREALAEVALDVAEGADMVMVKPALTYLDVIAGVRAAFDVPVAAYHVSGEYAMVKAAAEQGWIDGPAVALEQVTAVKRAGADFVLTYFAGELAEVLGGVKEPVSAALFERARRVHPRRGQLAGALVPLGGGHALLRGPGRGRLRVGRRREPAARLRPVLRGLHPRSRPPAVVGAIDGAAGLGTTFGAPTEGEVLLAEAICARVDGCEQVRLVSSGTEAAMSAVRLARGFTGRSRIVKFAGCYHGHSDGLLAGGAAAWPPSGLPDSAGVPAGAVAETVVAPYNRVPELDEQVACVIVEPVAANMGLVRPAPASSRGCGAACDAVGALLVFDEVITGFRLGEGGASAWSGVRPDLWCFGKVIGGGLPVGAFGGRADVLEWLAPEGPVYQAGTLSGNPLATAAGSGRPPVPRRRRLHGVVRTGGRFGRALEEVLTVGLSKGERWTPPATRSKPRSRWSAHSSACSSCRSGPIRSRTTTELRPRPPPVSTPPCSGRCWPGAWPWPRVPTRWRSRRWPTVCPSSSAPSSWRPTPSPTPSPSPTADRAIGRSGVGGSIPTGSSTPRSGRSSQVCPGADSAFPSEAGRSVPRNLPRVRRNSTATASRWWSAAILFAGASAATGAITESMHAMLLIEPKARSGVHPRRSRSVT